MMKKIKNDEDLIQAFKQLESVFQAKNGTREADERDILVTLIEVYENQHYSIAHADTVEAIKFQMEQLNLDKKDLEAYLGVSSKVSEVLNRKRNLSLAMIKKLHKGLNIPYESLIH